MFDQLIRERHTGTRLSLQSGASVLARKIDMLDLVVAGRIPLPMVGLVHEILTHQAAPFSVNNLTERMPLIRAIVASAIVEPKMVSDTTDLTPFPGDETGFRYLVGDTEVWDVGILPTTDLLDIWAWATPEVRPFAAFSGKQSRNGKTD